MQNYQKNQEHVSYTVETQKRVEPKGDEPVLKTLGTPNSEQTQLHTFNHA
jgi:hypothetical protein